MNDSIPTSLSGKVALITGAGKGMGAAFAHELAAAGARIVLVSRTERELTQVADQIQATHGAKSALAMPCDIGSESEVAQLFARTLNQLGPVDILINNAATFLNKTFIEQSAEEFDRVMRTNIGGAVHCCREAMRQMKRSGRGGSIVNISSLAGVRGTEKFPGLSSYVTSKFALVGLTEALAVEGRLLGIRVNCLAPGAVNTEMLRAALPHLKTSTQPEDIARTVRYLCDPALSGHINGSTLEIYSNE